MAELLGPDQKLPTRIPQATADRFQTVTRSGGADQHAENTGNQASADLPAMPRDPLAGPAQEPMGRDEVWRRIRDHRNHTMPAEPVRHPGQMDQDVYPPMTGAESLRNRWPSVDIRPSTHPGKMHRDLHPQREPLQGVMDDTTAGEVRRWARSQPRDHSGDLRTGLANQSNATTREPSLFQTETFTTAPEPANWFTPGVTPATELTPQVSAPTPVAEAPAGKVFDLSRARDVFRRLRPSHTGRHVAPQRGRHAA